MPQWAGRGTIFAISIQDDKAFCAREERYWMPVDLYQWRRARQILHLLYSRFWHKVLHDRGPQHARAVPALVSQGMSSAKSIYRLHVQGWLSAEDVNYDGNVAKYKDGDNELQCVSLTKTRSSRKPFRHQDNPHRVDARAHKMSKSGQRHQPDDVVAEYEQPASLRCS